MSDDKNAIEKVNDKAKEIEEWFRRNLIPVIIILIALVTLAILFGTKAGRKVVSKATGAPIKRS